MEDKGEIVIYQTQDGITQLDVRLDGETVWITQEQMAQLFERDRTAIGRHISNIFAEGELDKKMVCANFAHTTQHGAIEGKTQTRELTYYNLDVIISVGYRVKSQRGVQFRQWATKRIHEYIVKGFTLDDERLKGNGGGQYWRELIQRIQEIRTDERMIYRQVLDLYATAHDYDKKTVRKQLVLAKSMRGASSKGTAFAGRPEGQQVREELKLKTLDTDVNLYSIVLPDDTTSFNPSFYLGLFFESVKKLGWEKFQEKYQFDYTIFRPVLAEVIRQNIDECERKAKNELNKKTGLDI